VAKLLGRLFANNSSSSSNGNSIGSGNGNGKRHSKQLTANYQRGTTNIGNAKNLTHYEHLGSLAECI